MLPRLLPGEYRLWKVSVPGEKGTSMDFLSRSAWHISLFSWVIISAFSALARSSQSSWAPFCVYSKKWLTLVICSFSRWPVERKRQKD